jgi:hypothetical protein
VWHTGALQFCTWAGLASPPPVQTASVGLRSGVLTCDEGWRFFGMASAPQEKAGNKGAQGKISSFFGKKPATASAAVTPLSPQSATASDVDHYDPPTPGGGAQSAGDVTRREQEVARLTAERLTVATLAGHVEGEPLLLSNLASPLANATRLLAAARRRACARP